MTEPPPEEPSFGPDPSGWTAGKFLAGCLAWGILGNGIVLVVLFVTLSALDAWSVGYKTWGPILVGIPLAMFIGLLIAAIGYAHRTENRALRDGIATAAALTGAAICLVASMCGGLI